MSDMTELFVQADDFCILFEPEWKKTLLQAKPKKRNRASSLSLSEIMTIVIYFHHSNYRDFKHYYTGYIGGFYHDEFPKLVSYNRFVELMQEVLIPLLCFLHARRGEVTGISFIDSTTLQACHIKREKIHRVFSGLAAKGKNSLGWFYGFKLHLIMNDCGELLAFKLTPGNTDDRKPVPEMTEGLFGKLFGDKGYISQALFEQLLAKGVQLVTKLKKNMKNKLMPVLDKILLRKRALIETVNDQLKNILQIEHTRHRSVTNFMINLVSGLIAYTYRDKLPSLNLRAPEINNLPVLA